MSRFNTSSTHPLIPNSQNYMYEKKYVSIHSEDRDIIRYPNSNEFEIELPQDYCNVESVRLTQWTFPANYDVFAVERNNITMTFKITEPYNPGAADHLSNDPLLEVIFQALYYHIDTPYIVLIEQGFYNPDQMATELTNRFNSVVTNVILEYINSKTDIELPNKSELLDRLILQGGYNQFVVAYNSVGQKLWFGNKSSNFKITNSDISALTKAMNTYQCSKTKLPEYVGWGLPEYLGFARCDAIPTPSTERNVLGIFPGILGYPRFYYGDYKPGDDGYWLVPDIEYKGAIVYYLEAPKKINLMGEAYFYLEIHGMNNIDETSPFALSPFTIQTNETNGIVNAAFAKIAVPTTPISQWFDTDLDNYKWYNPPAERIRKLKFKLRYHNGLAVNFGEFNYSITLEFCIFNPQINRKVNMYVPNNIP
jgi:hypothetical protein